MKAPFLVALTLLICAAAWAAPPNKNQYILVKNRYLFQQPNASAARRPPFRGRFEAS
jgi:hypothetical protein